MVYNSIKEKLRKLPDSPGIYIMRGADGSIIYIGKAVSLKKRVSSYFQKKRGGDTKTVYLVNDIVDFEFFTVKSEEEALIVEAKLIREFQPKYNISLKDDKRYPMVRLSVNEDFPRLSVVRMAKDDGATYYGPFTDAGGLRKVLRLAQGLFKLRGCKFVKLNKSQAKHCLYCKINACLKPCLGAITKEEYGKVIDEVVTLLNGNSSRLIYDLKREMKAASVRQDYEAAANIRDSIRALESVLGTRIRNINIYRRIAPDLRKGMEELKVVLGMDLLPSTIEAIDISNISGLMAVGALVVFKNGVPFKDGYRRFRIKDVHEIDDYKMVREVVRRRYSRIVGEGRRLPDLILIDGGKGHLSSAVEEAEILGLKRVYFASIAKENEEIFMPGRSAPIALDRGSQGLLLIEHIRDEAHRFAIGYHRSLREKKIKESILDDIPGIGEERKKVLLSYFGSIDRIRGKTADEIAAAPGINKKLAEEILDYLHRKQEG